MFVRSVVFVGSFLLPLGCWVSAKKWLQLLVYNISKKSYSNAKTIINAFIVLHVPKRSRMRISNLHSWGIHFRWAVGHNKKPNKSIPPLKRDGYIACT